MERKGDTRADRLPGGLLQDVSQSVASERDAQALTGEIGEIIEGSLDLPIADIEVRERTIK